MKVFFDSSVLIAALLSSSGASAKILAFCEAGLLDACVSEEVIDEVYDVLEREFSEIKENFGLLLRVVGFKKVSADDKPLIKKAKGWIDDPDDVHVLVGAKVSKVEYLVTLDIKDFIRNERVAKVSGLKILTPAGFLQTVIEENFV